MGTVWQYIICSLVIVLSAVILARRFLNMMSGKGDASACGSCAKCPQANAANHSESLATVTIKPLVELQIRQTANAKLQNPHDKTVR